MDKLLSNSIKEHKIYWMNNNRLSIGTYSKDWSLLILYYMVASGVFDLWKEKAKIAHSWGFILSIDDYKLGLKILLDFAEEIGLTEDDMRGVIKNMTSIDANHVAFVHYGFVVDYDNKQVERVLCSCSYCSKPLVKDNRNGESQEEILAQLLCLN